jgi:ABC-type transporter Mla MlaB component
MGYSSIVQAVGSVALLVGVVMVLVRSRQHTHVGIHIVAENVSRLEALCRAANGLLQSWPPPETVVIDLTEVEALDAVSVARLDQACRRWSRAGVTVSIEGCTRQVVAALARGGLDAAICCSDRVSDFASSSLSAPESSRERAPMQGNVEPFWD